MEGHPKVGRKDEGKRDLPALKPELTHQPEELKQKYSLLHTSNTESDLSLVVELIFTTNSEWAGRRSHIHQGGPFTVT